MMTNAFYTLYAFFLNLMYRIADLSENELYMVLMPGKFFLR